MTACPAGDIASPPSSSQHTLIAGPSHDTRIDVDSRPGGPLMPDGRVRNATSSSRVSRLVIQWTTPSHHHDVRLVF